VGLFICILTSNMVLFRRQIPGNFCIETRLKKTAVLLVTCLAFIGVFLIPHKFSASQISSQNKIESIRYRSDIQVIDDIDPYGIFVYIGAQIAAEGINPWSERTLLANKRFLGLGWATQSPHQEKRKQSMDLDGNFLSQFIDDPHKYLLTNSFIAELLEYSYERRTEKRVKLVSLKELPYGTVFKLVTENKVVTSTEKSKPANGQR